MDNNYESKKLIGKLEDRYVSLVNSELESYRNILAGIKNVTRYLPVTKPRSETIPAIFDKSFDENFISDYLAYVLDPDRNGIGFLPLLKILGVRKQYQGLGIEFGKDIGRVEVTREYTFQNGVRIDLLIKLGEVIVVGIENKISSGETGKQTITYASSVKREFPDYDILLFYLTPQGARPASREFQPISYANVLDLLSTVNLKGVNDLRKLVIYQDLLNHIREYIMIKKGITITEKTKLYIEHSEMIEDLWESVKKDSSSYFDLITHVIRNYFTADIWNIEFREARSFQQVVKENWVPKDIWIHFEFSFSAEDLFFIDSIRFMVDVEGKRKDVFLDSFDRDYPGIKEMYKGRDILYRPSHRRNAIGFKEFKLPKRIFMMKPAEIESFFIKMSEEFSFLIEPIDKVLAKIGKK